MIVYVKRTRCRILRHVGFQDTSELKATTVGCMRYDTINVVSFIKREIEFTNSIYIKHNN